MDLADVAGKRVARQVEQDLFCLERAWITPLPFLKYEEHSNYHEHEPHNVIPLTAFF